MATIDTSSSIFTNSLVKLIGDTIEEKLEPVLELITESKEEVIKHADEINTTTNKNMQAQFADQEERFAGHIKKLNGRIITIESKIDKINK